MQDVFDTINPPQNSSAKDLFDTINPATTTATKDIFDQVNPPKPEPSSTPASDEALQQTEELTKPAGLLVSGNINLDNRPIIKSYDGNSISTLRSTSVNIDGKEILIPMVAENGSGVLSIGDAIKQYKTTGQHLGVFDSPEAATQYAIGLHKRQNRVYAGNPSAQAIPSVNTGTELNANFPAGTLGGYQPPVYPPVQSFNSPVVEEIKSAPSIMSDLGKGDLVGAIGAAKDHLMQYFTQQPDKYDELRAKAEAQHTIDFGQYPIGQHELPYAAEVKGAYNTASKLMSGLINPQTASMIVAGTALEGPGGAIGPLVNRAMAGKFALDSFAGATKAVERAKSLPTGSPEQQEAYADARSQLIMGGFLTAGVGAPMRPVELRKPETAVVEPKPVETQPQTFTESGQPVAEVPPVPETVQAPVETISPLQAEIQKAGDLNASKTREGAPQGSQQTQSVGQGTEGLVRIRGDAKTGLETPPSPQAETILTGKAGEIQSEQTTQSRQSPPAQTETGYGQTSAEQGRTDLGGQKQTPDVVTGAGVETPPARTTGIAQRIHEERGFSVMPGDGVDTPQMIARGRDLMGSGYDPEIRLRQMEQSGSNAVSADDIALLRAKHEELGRATNAAEDQLRANPSSPTAKAQYNDAWNAESDWANRVKPFQTEWHKIGMAQQGTTDMDTGSFSGLRRGFVEAQGRDLKPSEVPKVQKMADRVKRMSSDVEQSIKKYDEIVTRETKGRPPQDLNQLRERFANRIRELTPC